MPRYFFHRTDGRRDRDTEGTELPNLDAARNEAVLYLAATIRDDPKEIWTTGDLRVDVADDRGLLLLTIVMSAIEAPAVAR